MKVKLSYLLLLMFINLSLGQNSAKIVGKVFSKTDNTPLFMVNIFLVGTTIGTTSNDKGEFEIKNVPEGKHEIIFSMIGFETVIKLYTISANKIFEISSIYLIEKSYTTEEVAVEASEDSDWQDNYEIFKKVFFGKSDFAKECEITNKFYINFEKKDGYLIAKVDRQLNIINKELGYEINCELLSFEYNVFNKSSHFIVKNFFKNLVPKSEVDKTKWDENRRIAYLGSEQHFFKSFLENKFSDKWSVAKILQPRKDLNHKQTGIYNLNTTFLKFQESSNNYKFSFNGYLEITYKPRYFITVIELNTEFVTLNMDGYFDEVTPYKRYGYWGQLGLSSMLPKDFDGMK